VEKLAWRKARLDSSTVCASTAKCADVGIFQQGKPNKTELKKMVKIRLARDVT
jgi:hypothetical protein